MLAQTERCRLETVAITRAGIHILTLRPQKAADQWVIVHILDVYLVTGHDTRVLCMGTIISGWFVWFDSQKRSFLLCCANIEATF